MEKEKYLELSFTGLTQAFPAAQLNGFSPLASGTFSNAHIVLIRYDRFESKFNLTDFFSLLHFPLIKQLEGTIILKQNSADIKTSKGLEKGAGSSVAHQEN